MKTALGSGRAGGIGALLAIVGGMLAGCSADLVPLPASNCQPGALPAQTGVICMLGTVGPGGTGGRNTALGMASNGPPGLRLDAHRLD